MKNKQLIKNVAVIGAGYVGLPLAVAIAEAGYQVTIIDTDESKVRSLSESHKPIKVTSDIKEVKDAEVIIVAVPTPVHDHSPDLSYVISATEGLARYIKKGTTVVYESTYGPGTTKDLAYEIQKITDYELGIDFEVAFSPERVRPGSGIHVADIPKLVGVRDGYEGEEIVDFYLDFISAGVKKTSIEVAELSKLMENCQIDWHVAFFNLFSRISGVLGIPFHEVLEAANTKPEFKRGHAGLVGGHCIPVDPYYLVKALREYSKDSGSSDGDEYLIAQLLNIRSLNDSQVDYYHRIIFANFSKRSSLLIVGITFKDDIDDLRESLALRLAEKLDGTYEVHMYDSMFYGDTKADLWNPRTLDTSELSKYDGIIYLQHHKNFRLNPAEYLKPGGRIFDPRNCFPNLSSIKL